jgi:hypothetical protein
LFFLSPQKTSKIILHLDNIAITISKKNLLNFPKWPSKTIKPENWKRWASLEREKSSYITLATLRGSIWFVIGHIISCQLTGTIFAPIVRKNIYIYTQEEEGS